MTLSENVYTVKDLNHLLEKQKNVIVYGIGLYGKCLVDYMRCTGRTNQISAIIVTDASMADKEYQEFKIQEAASFLERNNGGVVIIAVSFPYQSEVLQIVNKYTANCIIVSDRLFCEMDRAIGSGEITSLNGKIDFCIAGFQKCGTTSVYHALNETEQIYLPKEKETLFFEWNGKVAKPEELLLRRHYGNVLKGQTVGMAEPSFARYPRQVKALLGSDIKLIFLLRNPVNALFSSFKMLTHQGSGGGEVRELYQKNDSCAEMFTDYLRNRLEQRVLTDMHYSFWLEPFYNLFSDRQIKIILFEELIQNPKAKMNEIFDFLGVEETYATDALHHDNKGDFMMANEEGYIVAEQRLRYVKEERTIAKDDVENRLELEKKRNEIEEKYGKAKKVFGVKMTEKQRELAKDLFNNDVKRLEMLIKRNLMEIWNWQ